jgi:DNA invertase Pin-like site-specific DNA recombinase
LGRSLRDLITMLDDLRKRVKFRSLTEAIDTTTPTGRAGVIDAKARGVKFGRKAKLTRQQAQQARKLIAQGERPADVAVSFHVGRTTLYRALAAA